MSHKVFVKNLPFTTTAGDLHKLFEHCGKVSVEVVKNSHTSKSKGIAFLLFETEEAMELALKKDGELLGGRVMKVIKYYPRPHGENRRYNRRRRNYGREPREDEVCFGYPVNQQIYVGNIGDLDEANVHAIFLPFGEIAQVDIMRNKRTGEPKGYGFVIFQNPMAAKAALEMNGEEPVVGRKLKVSAARMKNNYPREGRMDFGMGSMNSEQSPVFNMWPNCQMGTPMQMGPYIEIENPYLAPADFPSQEPIPSQNIHPLPGGLMPMGTFEKTTPPPLSPHSTSAAPYFIASNGIGQPGYLNGPAPTDVQGLITGFHNMGFDSNYTTNYPPRTEMYEERRNLQPGTDRV